MASQTWPLSADFAIWTWQGSVVAGDWLYIDGGEYRTNGGSSITSSSIPINVTFAFDLTIAWTNSTVNAKVIPKPPNMPATRRPTLWYNSDSQSVYEWGGWTYHNAASTILGSYWSFTPDGHGGANWTQNLQPTAGQYPLSPTFGQAWTFSPTSYYSIGGIFPKEGGGASNVSKSGIVSYDFSSNTWNNESSAGLDSTGLTVLSEATYIPNFGKSGLLIPLGGDNPTNSSYFYESGLELADMSNITLYDIASKSWYYQSTTGVVPPGRSEFCSVGVPAPDNSSYEIFVLGGSTNQTYDEAHDGAGFRDVFILSLPSFHWFQVTGSAKPRRAVHHCQVIGKRQMLVIGGYNPVSGGSNPDPDPNTNGLGIFDMTALDWTAGYDPNAEPYQQSQVVQQYYESNSPNSMRWDNPNLSSIFAIQEISSGPNNATNTTNPGQSSPVRASDNHAGAIAGGVVGGVIFLAILAALGFWIFKRRRTSTHAYQPPTHPPPPGGPEFTPSAELSGDSGAEGRVHPMHEMEGKARQVSEME